MGCAQSRIDNEESVSRCKDRKILMKEALAARNAFAAAHSAYAIALKHSGAALNDYAHGETDEPPTIPAAPLPAVSAPPPPPQDPLPPPPPPLPSFSPSPLQRSATMPELPLSKRGVSKMGSIAIHEDDDFEDPDENEIKNDGRNLRDLGGKSGVPLRSPQMNMEAPPPPPPIELKGVAWDYFMMENMPVPGLEEEDEDEIDEDDDDYDHKKDQNAEEIGVGDGSEVEFKTPEKGATKMAPVEEAVEMETPPPPEGVKQFVHSNTAPAEFKEGTKMGNGMNLMKVLGQIDDHFLKASECAQEVSKLLDATRFQYHSNFADNNVPVDHAARVMRVITWNRSLRGTPGGDGGQDDYYSVKNETLATVLDKLMAWEKKLYEEVKAGELMKLEYQRKVALLNRQKKRGASVESLEKTKAAVSHLHTRYIVDMQSMDSTVSEVNDLRDLQLYPKLVELVDGMAKMWENVSEHHDTQLEIATSLKSLDVSLMPWETSKRHHQCTVQLSDVIAKWQDQFQYMVAHQKQYVRTLYSWLKLNLIPIESSLKEKISSPPRAQTPPIQPLLQAWHDSVDKLPDEVAKTAVGSFNAMIKTILLQQEEELKLKDKCEETRKEYLKKKQAFEDWYHKHGPRHEVDLGDEGAGPGKDPVSERQFIVESLKKRLEEDVESHQKHCIQVREKSLGTLKTCLPELFRSLSDYAHTSADAYNKLRAIVMSQSNNGGP